jgi:hypothetical protein
MRVQRVVVVTYIHRQLTDWRQHAGRGQPTSPKVHRQFRRKSLQNVWYGGCIPPRLQTEEKPQTTRRTFSFPVSTSRGTNKRLDIAYRTCAQHFVITKQLQQECLTYGGHAKYIFKQRCTIFTNILTATPKLQSPESCIRLSSLLRTHRHYAQPYTIQSPRWHGAWNFSTRVTKVTIAHKKRPHAAESVKHFTILQAFQELRFENDCFKP